MLHSFICILDFNISNMIQSLISEREEIETQHKVLPSKSQFLLMHREPTGHSVAQKHLLEKHLLKLGRRGHLVPFSTTFSYHILRISW